MAHKVRNFRIFVLVVLGIAISSVILGGLWSIPVAESKSSVTSSNKSSHSRVSSGIGGSSTSGNLGSATGSVGTSASNTGNRVVMINFDDGYKSQFLYAKPILDQYGFKASFFIPCAKMQTVPKWLTWQQITALKSDGMDIESHTMTHAHLTDLLGSPATLTYEIGFAKQCLASHGFNTPIFAYPLNLGSDNPTIVNLVAKYYDLARSGSNPLMFLNCKGYPTHPQTDCRTYSADGKLTYANRYDIRSESFYHISSNLSFIPAEMFQKFVQRMNSYTPYNANGKINAIPIIVYHDLTYSIQDYNGMASMITVPLFAQEMQYLHDNGFNVLVLNELGYDTTNNVFYVKKVPLSASTSTTAIGTTTTTSNATTIGKDSLS